MRGHSEYGLADLVPRLGPVPPPEIGGSLDLRALPAAAGGLYPHQLRAIRAAALSGGALLLMHHPGQGKTRAMIGAAERWRGSYGVTTVHVVTKQNITKDTLRDIEAHTGSPQSQQFYTFHTHLTFNATYGRHSDEELRRALGRSILVVDEIHAIYSYVRPNPDGSPTAYQTLVRVRNLLPELQIIALSATPMLSSSYELAYLAHMLIPAAEIYRRHPPLATGNAALFARPRGPPGAADPPGPPGEDGETPEDARREVPLYTALFCELVPVAHAAPPGAATQLRRGPEFGLSPPELQRALQLVGAPPEWSAAPPAPGRHRRQPLLMHPTQCAAYAQVFAEQGTRGFFQQHRVASVCAPSITELLARCAREGRPPTVAEVREHSALFAYWLERELEALAEGHGGASAWYLDDIVSGGAHHWRDLLLACGWELWSAERRPPAPGARRPPALLFLSSEDLLSHRMREDIADDRNVDGSLVRTIIYTRALNVGVSFPGVLRGGSVPTWTEGIQLQADARRLRGNSFARFEPHLANPAFRAAHARYLSPDGKSIAPAAYDALVLPPPTEAIRAHAAYLQDAAYSIDAHMLRIRAEKGREIDGAQEALIAGSVDARARSAPPEAQHPGNYLTRYLLPDLRAALREFRTEAPPRAPTALAPPGLGAAALTEAQRAFCAPMTKEVEGPLQGTPALCWGAGSMGLGPSPGTAAAAAATAASDPERLPPRALFHPRTEDAIRELHRLLCGALAALGDHLSALREPHSLAELAAHRPERLRLPELAARLGATPLLALGMYASYWCYAEQQTTKGREIRTGQRFYESATHTPAVLQSYLANWERVPTLLHAPPAAPGRQLCSWCPTRQGHRWTDPFSIHGYVQQLWESRPGAPGAQTFNYAVIAHNLSAHHFTAQYSVRPKFMALKGDPDYGQIARQGAQRNGTCVIKSPTLSEIILYTYDESPGGARGHYEGTALPFAAGAVFRYVKVPEFTDDNGTRHRCTFNEKCPQETQRYLDWAFRTIAARLRYPWTITSV